MPAVTYDSRNPAGDRAPSALARSRPSSDGPQGPSGGLSSSDARRLLHRALREGRELTPETYAVAAGTRPSTVARWIAAERFSIRAERAEVEPAVVGALSDTVRVILQSASLDVVLRAAAELGVDAQVPASEMKKIVRDANRARSEEDALAVVARARADRAPEIRALVCGLKTPARRRLGSAGHVNALLKYSTNELLDVAPSQQSETYSSLSRLHDRLGEVLAEAQILWAPERRRLSSTDAPAN
jgi:hypothetical protein